MVDWTVATLDSLADYSVGSMVDKWVCEKVGMTAVCLAESKAVELVAVLVDEKVAQTVVK